MKDKGKPKPGVEYHLTGGPGQPSIANGNTWEESKVELKKMIKEDAKKFLKSKDGRDYIALREDEKDPNVAMPFPDALDQHQIMKKGIVR